MTKLAIIHTTPATVEPLKALAAEKLPGVKVINFVDDSILPQLAENGGRVAEVEERLVAYARYARQAGADAILEACSSVGEVVEKMQAAVDIPVVRIDANMAEAAVQRATRIGVAATLSTTLNPTCRLLENQASGVGKTISLEPALVSEAYTRLMAGDREGHDTLLASALQNLAQRVEVVVLAQASMARVLEALPEAERGHFLTSPPLAMEQVRRALEAVRG